MHEHCMMIVQDHWDTIVRAYLDFEEKKPIILLDIQKHKIYAYPYQDFVEKYRDDWSVFGKLDQLPRWSIYRGHARDWSPFKVLLGVWKRLIDKMTEEELIDLNHRH